MHTDVFIRGTHFLKMHNLDVTDCSQTTYDHWLQLYDEDIDKYLEAVNQEHVNKSQLNLTLTVPTN